MKEQELDLPVWAKVGLGLVAGIPFGIWWLTKAIKTAGAKRK